ncbi:hypothetical protein AB0M79_13160 [Polymorphospora sp. NPDC051019]|uniref:hypothetical protein n=1 Tax=Polymorphospora sp. NPDC051019 TaxID=3155725 RepID=UPI00342196AC
MASQWVLRQPVEDGSSPVVEEDEIEPVRVHMYVALRFGDLYAVVVIVSDDRQRTDAIVARAVERLCTVANSGC